MAQRSATDPFSSLEFEPPATIQRDLREWALPADIVEDARAYTRAARARRTQEAYRRAGRGSRRCRAAAGRFLRPGTVAAWMTAPATRTATAGPGALQHQSETLSAVVVAQRAAGHTFVASMPDQQRVARDLQHQGQDGGGAQARPLVADELQATGWSAPTSHRTRAMRLLALGWAGALRARLVARGSNSARRRVRAGDGLGANQANVVKAGEPGSGGVVVPRADMPTARDRLGRGRMACLKPGDAVFCAVDQRHRSAGVDRRADG